MSANFIMKESIGNIPEKTPDKNTTTNVSEEILNEVSSSDEVQSSSTNEVPSTEVPSTEVPPTEVPETEVPPTEVPENGSNLQFNRSNIESLGNFVHLVDSDHSDEENKLDMFCYVKCSQSDSNLLKQCRGVVFNGEKLVMKAFPYTTEYNHTEDEKVSETLGDIKDWVFYDSHEGALIRMFYFNNKWYVSTHRKLNAFRSKWSSNESFGTIFKSALSSEEEENEKFRNRLPKGDNILERFQSTLDKSKQYMFLIRNNKDNRIVCDPPSRPTVLHVGTFDDGNLIMTDNVDLPFPNKLNFSTVDELLRHVKHSSYKDVQGVIGFTADNRQLKVLHQDYQDLFKSRGNEPSVKFRYLQVRMNRRLTNMLYYLYPDKASIFDEYEDSLYDIARSIYRAYVQRFIKKRYVTVPREEFTIIRECHSWHLSDRTNNRISLNQVIKVMNQQSPTHLNRMIRRFKLEQIKQNEYRKSSRPREDSLRSTKSFEQSPDVRKINSNFTQIPNIILPNNRQHQQNNNYVANIIPRKNHT
jgi:hypothetical protein